MPGLKYRQLLVLAGIISLSHAVGAPALAEDTAAAPAEQTDRRSQSGYERIVQFGGPDGVSGQLRQND